MKKMMKKALSLTLSLMLILSAQAVFASNLEDLYPGYGEGQAYFEMLLDNYPSSAIDSSLLTSAGRIDVVNGGGRLSMKTDSEKTGYVLALQTKSGNDSPQLRFVSSATGATGDVAENSAMSSGIYKISFDVKFNYAIPRGDILTFHDVKGKTDVYWGNYFLSNMAADGTQTENFMAFGADTGIKVETDKWYSIEYYFDYINHDMTICIDDAVFTDVKFSGTSFNYFRPMYYSGADAFVYYDDMKLCKLSDTAPVPSSDKYAAYTSGQKLFEADFATTDYSAKIGRLDVVNGGGRLALDNGALRMQTKTTDNSSQLRLVSDSNGTTAGDNPAMSGGVYRMSFDVKFFSTSTARELMTFHDKNAKTDVFWANYFLNTVASGNTASPTFLAFGKDTGIATAADKWYSIEYIFDYTTNDMTISIDGTSFTDENFSGTSFDYFRPFAYYGTGDFTYYDNIVLEKLEPLSGFAASDVSVTNYAGGELTDLYSGIKASCNIVNNTTGSKAVNLIVAAYSDEGKYLDCIWMDRAILPANSGASKLLVAVPVEELLGSYSVKVFAVGDMNTVIPLGEAFAY